MTHDHGHGHAHGHGHGSPPPPTTAGNHAFVVGVLLNAGFVVVEGVFGVLAHSAALVADAAHNLSDVAGLILAWGASVLATRRPSARRTYGLRRSTVLAALANAVLLLVAIGGVLREAIGRLWAPGDVAGKTVMIVAAAGFLVNGVSATLFFRGRERDANVRGAFLHLAADAGVSLAVVFTGLLLWQTGFMWLDPIVSIAVSLVVLGSTWGLLKDSLHLALDGVPGHVKLSEVRSFLESRPNVREVHDLHVWAMSTTETALTAHLVMPWDECAPTFLHELQEELLRRFAIDHATVQIEPDDGDVPCRQGAGGAV